MGVSYVFSCFFQLFSALLYVSWPSPLMVLQPAITSNSHNIRNAISLFMVLSFTKMLLVMWTI